MGSLGDPWGLLGAKMARRRYNKCQKTLRPPLWTSEHLIAGWIDRPDPQRPTHAKTSNSLMGCCPSRNVGSPSWTRTPWLCSRSFFFSSPSPPLQKAFKSHNVLSDCIERLYSKCQKPAAPPWTCEQLKFLDGLLPIKECGESLLDEDSPAAQQSFFTSSSSQYLEDKT